MHCIECWKPTILLTRHFNLDTETLWDNSGNNIGWINPSDDGPIICQNPNIEDLGGYTVSHPTQPVSVITLCTAEINEMIANGESLTSEAGTVYALNAINLDDIFEGSFTMLLIHELSHTKALLGNAKTGML